MQTVVLDTRGRLVLLSVVPPQFDPDPFTGDSASPPWPQLFQAAGLDIATFSAVAPQWNPRDYADVREAWEGPFDDSGQKVRVEASAYRGGPVSFAIVGPWTRATRMQPTRSSSDRYGVHRDQLRDDCSDHRSHPPGPAQRSSPSGRSHGRDAPGGCGTGD